MSWHEATDITRRWADMSDAAARDRGVSEERIRAARALVAELPDKDALYVLRNELVGKILHRLADMFAQRGSADFRMEEAVTPVVTPTEETR